MCHRVELFSVFTRSSRATCAIEEPEVTDAGRTPWLRIRRRPRTICRIVRRCRCRSRCRRVRRAGRGRRGRTVGRGLPRSRCQAGRFPRHASGAASAPAHVVDTYITGPTPVRGAGVVDAGWNLDPRMPLRRALRGGTQCSDLLLSGVGVDGFEPPTSAL